MYRQLLLFIVIQQTAGRQTVKTCLKYERNREGIFSDYNECPKSTLSCEVTILELPKGQRKPGDVWVPWGECSDFRWKGKPRDENLKHVYYHCCEEEKCNIVPHQFLYQPRTPRFFPDTATRMRVKWVVLVLCLNVAIRLLL